MTYYGNLLWKYILNVSSENPHFYLTAISNCIFLYIPAGECAAIYSCLYLWVVIKCNCRFSPLLIIISCLVGRIKCCRFVNFHFVVLIMVTCWKIGFGSIFIDGHRAAIAVKNPIVVANILHAPVGRIVLAVGRGDQQPGLRFKSPTKIKSI